jgi:hypothetical protein
LAAGSVTLRGIRYRAGRSFIVVLLATIAVAAAVIAPSYSRAAQQSILTDLVTDLPPAQAGLTARARSGPDDPPQTIASTRALLQAQIDQHSQLKARLAEAIGAVSLQTLAQVPGDPVAANLAYRQNACRHLRIQGSCATEPDQVVLSTRSAEKLGKTIGDTVAFKPGPGAVPRNVDLSRVKEHQYDIVGLYTPTDPTEPYWGVSYYFAFGPPDAKNPAQLDAVFTGSEDDLNVWSEVPPRVLVEYPLRAAEVRLDDANALVEGIGDITTQTASGPVSVTSSLSAVLTEYDTQESALSRSIPLVALPLVLLCWFVLFLVVAALTEERGGEIALGKLRGLQLSQVTRFGLAEPLVLVTLAAPIGFVVGLIVTEIGARLFLADGVAVEVRTPVIASALAALAGGVLAAVMAGRRTFAAGVLTLLRRIPERTSWRATAVEVAVAVLAVAAVYQIVATKDRTSPLSYAGPPLIALLAGLIAARLVALWARVRLRSARGRGNLVTMLAVAQIARRPAAGRIIAVVTVAVALLSFAVTVWDVAAVNRLVDAETTVGARSVYSVSAASPQVLLAGVDRADPSGAKAMAVVRSSTHYGSQAGNNVQMVGVDSGRLSAVGIWPNRTPSQVANYARELEASAAPTVEVPAGLVHLTADVITLQQGKPMGIAILLGQVDGSPTTLPLGHLESGKHTYSADNTCDRCRLLAIVVSKAAGDFNESSTKLTVSSLRVGDGELPVGLDRAGYWRVSKTYTDQNLSVGVSDGLAISAGGRSSADFVVEYADTPERQPVIVAGDSPADDPAADTFSFQGLGTNPQDFVLATRVGSLPRGGDQGLLFDLHTAILEASRSSSLADSDRLIYEVWANDKAGPEFRTALESAGLHVVRVETLSGRLDQLGRFAPALALRLYLLAGVVAVLLALGAVLLSAFVGSQGRLYELASLRVAGVSARTLRRGIRREYSMLLGLPLVIGVLAGMGGAALLLPAIPLVSVGLNAPVPVYRLSEVWVPGAVLIMAACFIIATAIVARLVRRATPQRLREGSR